MTDGTKVSDGACLDIGEQTSCDRMTARRNGIPRLLVIALVVVALDQFTKWVIASQLPLYEIIPVVKGFFNITHLQNPGGAFGIFANAGPEVRHFFFLGVTIFAMGMVFHFYRTIPTTYPSLSFGLALIFGGAAGNLIDRIRSGEVVDFLDFYVKGWHFPAFNVADSAITIGISICIWHFIFHNENGR